MQILVLIVILGILVGIELLYYRRHALDRVDLDVHFSQNIANFGEVIELVEIAQNNKKLPLPFLLLKFETPLVLEFQDMTNTSVSDLLYREDILTMKPFSRHTRKIKARCSKRGYYPIARVNISTSDLLLLERMTKECDADDSITILPERLDPSEIKPLLSITFSDILQRRTLLTDPFSFAGIREYQPWDPMRSINWTATAKTGDFMVNQNASTSTRQVSIFVNLEVYNTKKSTNLLEKSISMAFSYMCELVRMGIPTTIYTNGKDVQFCSPVISDMVADESGLLRQGVDLARIDLSQEVLPFPLLLEEHALKMNRDDFIVVISPKYDGSLRPALLHLKHTHPSLLWVMPAYKVTPSVQLESELASGYYRWEVIGHD